MHPDDLERAADAFEAAAHEVPAVLDGLVPYHRADVWQGQRATRFGTELTEARLRARAVALALTAQASTLRAQAGMLRAVRSGP